LESAALGVPSITTDLSGFGRFLNAKNSSNKGIYVLERFGKSEEQVIEKFSKMLYDYAQFSEKDRVREKIKAKETAGLADWNELVKNYFDAHNIAIGKVYGG